MKRKRMYVTLFAIVLSMSLSACGTKQSEEVTNDENSALYLTKRVTNSAYTFKERPLSDLNIQKAAGLAFDNEQLYVTDVQNASIHVYDQAFQLLKRIQIPEITSPSLLLKADKVWYVLNHQTNTLFMLAHDFSEIVKRFPLPKKENASYYVDLSALNDKVYISLTTADLADAKIIEIDTTTNHIQKLEHTFLGFSDTDKENAYFINTMMFYKNEENSGFKGGENSLFLLKDNNFAKQGDLIEASYPGDFFYDHDFLYVYTAGWSSVDRYDKQFNYVDSIAVFPHSDLETIMAGNAEHLFVLMSREQKLYEVIKK